MGMQPLNVYLKFQPFSGHWSQTAGGGGQVISAHPRARILPFDRILTFERSLDAFAGLAPNGIRGE